jgi:hypothetical protein
MKSPTVRPGRFRREPVSTTTNKFLKGQGHNKYTRAHQAALAVLNDDADVKPTIAAAARTYMTTAYLVKVAVQRLRRSKPTNVGSQTPTQSAIAWWDTISDDAKDDLLLARQSDVWARINMITDPGSRGEKAATT